jgi:hypothetical protein
VRAAVVRLAVRRADLILPTSLAVAAEMISCYAVPPARTRVLSWGVSAVLVAARASVSAAAVRQAFGIPADATVVLSRFVVHLRFVGPTRSCPRSPAL